MIQGERNPPTRTPGVETDAACETARARVLRFLDGDRPLSEDRALRAHLERCETCNAHYRESLLFAARLGRERRLLLAARESRAELRAPVEERQGARLRRLRAMILPCALLVGLALLFTQNGVPRTVEGRLLAGRATTAGRDFDEHASRELLRGEWIETRADARLELRSQGTRLELHGGARLLVEEPRDVRFRIQLGRLDIEGPCSLRGAFGAIECLGGTASLTVDAERAELTSASAELDLVDSRGSRRVGPGESVALVLGPR